MTRRKQKSCHQCRTRHLKCDGELPCMHCRRSGRQCSKDNEHIFLNESNLGIVRRRKKYSLSFDDSQRWIELPSSVQFAEPAGSVSSGADSTVVTPSVASASCPRRSKSPSILSFNSGPASEFTFPLDPALEKIGNEVFQFENTFSISNDSFFPQVPPKSRRPSVRWPLESYQEALLMRHYVDELASWFDSVDGASHFTANIPELATESPALLNAIFALSAKHLSLAGKLDDSISLRYIDACYQALIPDLHAKAYESDHLAAVLILRLVMQMTDPAEADCNGNVFLGVGVFMDAWKANQSSSLHSQLFLSVVRLYFHVSWVTRKPIPEAEYDCCWMGEALDSLNEQARKGCCKMTMQASRCINFAYGDRPKTWERWLDLKNRSDKWREEMPKYFQPVFSQHPMEGDPFPKRLFASDVYASTHQFYSLARILMLNNQPTTPPPTHLGVVPLSQGEVEDETLMITRKIIGTALSHTQPALSMVATLAITYSGHLITDPLSQEHAYDLLQRASKECAGLVPPGEFARLRRVWRWDVDEVAYQNVL